MGITRDIVRVCTFSYGSWLAVVVKVKASVLLTLSSSGVAKLVPLGGHYYHNMTVLLK